MLGPLACQTRKGGDTTPKFMVSTFDDAGGFLLLFEVQLGPEELRRAGAISPSSS